MKGQEVELCSECGEETGKAGRCEDSLYLYSSITDEEIGPLCEACYDELERNDVQDFELLAQRSFF